MATTYYVDGAAGDDLNNGTTWGLAKKTIVGARAVTAAGDLVVIAPGVYPEVDQFWNSANDANVLYMADPNQAGVVIVDFENRIGTQTADIGTANWRFGQPTIFLNILFRNPASGNNRAMISGDAGAWFYHCVFYQRDGTAQTGRALSTVSAIGQLLHATNCTFYNLGHAAFSVSLTNWRNNYMINNANPIPTPSGSPDYNAYPGNTETNGIDTNVTDPGMRNPSNEDFRLHPTTIPADFQAFMTGGIDGGRIGAMGLGGFYYNALYPQLRMITADPTFAGGNPQPAWENEGPGGTNTYTTGTPGDVVQDGTSNELEIDLGAIPGATGGRIRSEVYDLGAVSPLVANAAFSAFEDGPAGALIDTNTTLPQTFEYRSSNTAFAKGDGTPTWNAVEQKDNLNQSHRYVQFRIEFRTDHTNA